MRSGTATSVHLRLALDLLKWPQPFLTSLEPLPQGMHTNAMEQEGSKSQISGLDVGLQCFGCLIEVCIIGIGQQGLWALAKGKG